MCCVCAHGIGQCERGCVGRADAACLLGVVLMHISADQASERATAERHCKLADWLAD